MNKRTGKTKIRKGQSGVGLIEVLIAVLVFAVGVLGMAAMQLAAKRTSYEATQRSVATSLARDIIERMRSNSDQLDAYDTAVTELRVAPDFSKNCGASGQNCSEAELVEYDVKDWSLLLTGDAQKVDIDGDGTAESVAGGILEPRACVDHTDGEVTVTIAWHGVNQIAPDSSITCGWSTGDYDASVAEDNLLRRTLVISTYIGEF